MSKEIIAANPGQPPEAKTQRNNARECVADYMRRIALIEMAELLITNAERMHDALTHDAMQAADAYFDTLSLIGREMRRTRAEMTSVAEASDD